MRLEDHEPTFVYASGSVNEKIKSLVFSAEEKSKENGYPITGNFRFFVVKIVTPYTSGDFPNTRRKSPKRCYRIIVGFSYFLIYL